MLLKDSKMKQILLFLFLTGITFSAFAAVKTVEPSNQKRYSVQNINPEMAQMGLQQFLEMTPKKYRKITGKRLGFANSIKLKMAQKYIKRKTKKSAGLPQILFFGMAMTWLGWLAMGILDGWSGANWIIALLLTMLCIIPGIIFSFIKMKEYYA